MGGGAGGLKPLHFEEWGGAKPPHFSNVHVYTFDIHTKSLKLLSEGLKSTL